MNRLTLETRRMILLAATEKIATAELLGRARFSQFIGARVPATWPPPLNDETTMTFLHAMLEGRPEAVGWAHWYWLLRTDTGDGVPVTIGNGGFMGPPDPDGQVEVGYSVLEMFQGLGLATEAVAALVRWAFDDPRVGRIIAQTDRGRNASRRVLEKLGFVRTGAGREPNTARFELLRRHAPAPLGPRAASGPRAARAPRGSGAPRSSRAPRGAR